MGLTLVSHKNFSVGGSSAPTFPSLPGLIGRYNAQPGNIVYNGSLNIISVTDLSPIGNNLSCFGTLKYNAASAYNSKPAFDCAGAAAVLYNSAFNTNGATGVTPFNLFFVTRPSSSISVFSLFGYQDCNGGTSSPVTTFYAVDGSTATTGNALNANYRWGVVCNGAVGTFDAELWLNGVNVVTNSFYSKSFTSGGNLGIGGTWDGASTGNNWYGPILEVVIGAGTAWTSGQIAALDAYFVAAYGT